MKGKRARAILLATYLVFMGKADAEQVEVVAKSALLKVGDEVIATVKQGERFEVLRREGPWVAISLPDLESDQEGWIFVTRVRDVIAPRVDQDSTAPGAFELIRPDIRMLQIVAGNPSRIFFELTLANQGAQAVRYDAATLALKVDDETVKPAPRTSPGNYWIYTDSSMNSRVPPAQIQFLGSGVIAPRGKVSGWVSFELPRVKSFRDPIPKRWILSGNFGKRDLRLDLKQHELDALDAQIRPSTIDPSVQVLEIGPRVNALNVEKHNESRKQLNDSNCLWRKCARLVEY